MRLDWTTPGTSVRAVTTAVTGQTVEVTTGEPDLDLVAAIGQVILGIDGTAAAGLDLDERRTTCNSDSALVSNSRTT